MHDHDLPPYSYSFVKLDDILKIKEKKEAEYLIGILNNASKFINFLMSNVWQTSNVGGG